MLSDFLKNHITSKAGYVDYGYGQVEPNHLSAQSTGQSYAQLPAAASIDVLEQGQFVKYDYVKGVVDFDGPGEWMLVYNEIKLYHEGQMDCEFALIKDNYQARVYSPFGYALDKNGQPVADEVFDRQARFLNGVDANGNTTDPYTGVAYDDVTAAPDMYELHYNEDPFHFAGPYKEAMMPANTSMVPRVFKTNIGDIFTTNTIAEAELALGDIVSPRTADGILSKDGDGTMRWQVVKLYTMPDHQKGVKLMRIA